MCPASDGLALWVGHLPAAPVQLLLQLLGVAGLLQNHIVRLGHNYRRNWGLEKREKGWFFLTKSGLGLVTIELKTIVPILICTALVQIFFETLIELRVSDQMFHILLQACLTENKITFAFNQKTIIFVLCLTLWSFDPRCLTPSSFDWWIFQATKMWNIWSGKIHAFNYRQRQTLCASHISAVQPTRRALLQSRHSWTAKYSRIHGF